MHGLAAKLYFQKRYSNKTCIPATAFLFLKLHREAHQFCAMPKPKPAGPVQCQDEILQKFKDRFLCFSKSGRPRVYPPGKLAVVAGRVCRVKHVVSCCCCCFHVRLLLVWLGALTPSIHEQKDAGKAHAACRNAYVSVTSRVRFGHCKIGRSPEKWRKRTICFLPQEMMVDTECAQLLCQKVTGFGAVKCEADICRNE